MTVNARLVNLSGGRYEGLYILEIPIADKSASEVLVGNFTFKKGDCVIPHLCYLDVETAEATGSTKTVDFGINSGESGGNAAGFGKAFSTATVGGVTVSATATAGTNTSFWAANPKLGALLRSGILGADAAATPGCMIPVPWISDGTAKTPSYTLASAHTELVGYLYITFFRPPLRAP